MIITDNGVSQIARAIEEGLSQKPKRLPSWLFYDETGDKLFQSIMEMPEYYLTRCEYEILESNKDVLQRLFTDRSQSFNLIELGAGDGLKTEILLKHFSKNNARFVYTPIDVSASVLKALKERVLRTIPDLVIEPNINRYEDALEALGHSELTKIFLFLGANIGNFTTGDARNFVTRLSAFMNTDDQLLIGFDLKKDPRLIHAAYDDLHGTTRDFNLNLLVRLNRELGADFETENFQHYPYYNPETGQNRSYLVSKMKQDVYLESVKKVFHFDEWEAIHTEVSQKYDARMINKLASEAGLEIVKFFYDQKAYFCDVLLRKS
ncbi:MAG: L-histidine N(alpha)-methyltransferase [Cyclobacteriaceae bacterium]